jgi:hypothetical protein
MIGFEITDEKQWTVRHGCESCVVRVLCKLDTVGGCRYVIHIETEQHSEMSIPCAIPSHMPWPEVVAGKV